MLDVSLSSWLIILLAIVLANVPFLNERIFCVIPVGSAEKSFWIRLLELFVLYYVVGGLAYLLEARIGNAFSQRWEFFAVTGCLFIVLAYPGFVLRYLRKRRG